MKNERQGVQKSIKSLIFKFICDQIMQKKLKLQFLRKNWNEIFLLISDHCAKGSFLQMVIFFKQTMKNK